MAKKAQSQTPFIQAFLSNCRQSLRLITAGKPLQFPVCFLTSFFETTTNAFTKIQNRVTKIAPASLALSFFGNTSNFLYVGLCKILRLKLDDL